MLPQDRFKVVEPIIKKKNGIKIAKGVVFLLLAVLFLFITTYNVKTEISNIGFQAYFFAKNYLNFAVSILFAVLGILELKEGATNGN